ncbi:cation efflux protein, CzcI family [Ottowia caeni]|jgi:hypothetical protein
MMRRWIAIFILILPLQFSWAAVASYCQHESEPAKTEHIGHHEHKHADTDTVGKTKKSEPSLDKSDRDCRLCGGLGLGVTQLHVAKQSVDRGNTMVAHISTPFTGVNPSPPDRPQWPVLA